MFFCNVTLPLLHQEFESMSPVLESIRSFSLFWATEMALHWLYLTSKIYLKSSAASTVISWNTPWRSCAILWESPNNYMEKTHREVNKDPRLTDLLGNCVTVAILKCPTLSPSQVLILPHETELPFQLLASFKITNELVL